MKGFTQYIGAGEQFVRTVIQPIQDFIYPPVCLTCDCLRSDRSSRICAECWNALVPLSDDHPVIREFRERFSQTADIGEITSCYLFEKEGKFQEFIHLLKYRGIKSVGKELGRKIGERMKHIDGSIRPSLGCVTADYLIPVPLHPIKKRERGYNQSDYLCMGISEVTGIPVHRGLIERSKYTQSQTALSVQERRENVGDAFRVHRKHSLEINDKSFVLVDDVITTGATIEACARLLRHQGARSVLAASAALAR
ncbi:MAG TPA: phosphoribosyltransferase family protein [Bacteroidota bacterium]|nr:phosphoribosyltransferase family protein [Bacteroidota bacterium]